LVQSWDDDYKMMISDLNAKIKDLDNEKNSLVTAIKILQEGKKCEDTGPLNAIKRQSANSPATKKIQAKRYALAVCKLRIATLF
jgi:hypothetical protein